MPAETKAATAGSGLPRNGAAVERAAGDGGGDKGRYHYSEDRAGAGKAMGPLLTTRRKTWVRKRADLANVG